MAKSSRILSLNLGMQSVCIAEFEALPEGGLQLRAFQKSDLIADPAADATRPTQLETVAKELREGLKLKPGTSVHACLPSQSVFSRFVKLPGATAQDVAGIIGFEAQQNVPFPIDEVVWDYQIMGEKRNDSWDVVLVAIKADHLEETVGAVKRGGLGINGIDFAPTALYNAYRYNYPGDSGCALLIDIGARTTNLVFCENSRLFCRSIPIGGSAITAAIAKEFSQDITLAEKLKVEKGSVALGGAYAGPADETEARIGKVVRNTLTRLHAEIARSINFYRTSQGGTTPKRVYLCGGNTGLPYIAEFFTEKLQARVEFFNPLRNVVVSEGALPSGTAACSLALSELVGCAAQQLGNPPLAINLSPPSLVRDRENARRIPRLAAAAAFLALTPALWWLNFNNSTKLAEDQSKPLKNKTELLEQIDLLIKECGALQKTLTTDYACVLLAPAERAAWPSIVSELAEKIPPRFIWITKLSPVTGTIQPPEPKNPAPPRPQVPADSKSASTAITAIQINGLYLDDPPNPKAATVVDDFYENLRDSTIFGVGEDRTNIITERTTPTGESWAYSYSMVLPLKKPIPLP
jgi:type IV pilus assembly protein PilM